MATPASCTCSAWKRAIRASISGLKWRTSPCKQQAHKNAVFRHLALHNAAAARRRNPGGAILGGRKSMSRLRYLNGPCRRVAECADSVPLDLT
jgi:hypothetical protein